MDWQEVKAEFEWDGSLRDLYIMETDVQLWQKAFDCLRTSPYSLTYTVDGEQAELPADVESIFRKRHEASAFLSIDVNDIRVNCFFFIEEQIEFDIDPREINTEARFGYLCEFIQRMGRGLVRSVILTSETSGREEKSVIIRYLPMTDQFEYTPGRRYY